MDSSCCAVMRVVLKPLSIIDMAHGKIPFKQDHTTVELLCSSDALSHLSVQQVGACLNSVNQDSKGWRSIAHRTPFCTW
jgi:hypothetical protein